MARPSGSRNADYEKRRAAIALSVSRALHGPDGRAPSMAALAKAAGVSVPTLKHYFTDHDGVVQAALQAAHGAAAVYLERVADPKGMPLGESIHAVGQDLLGGWPHGLGDLFGAALTHGLGSPTQGPAVVNHLLEPTIQGLEKRLLIHRLSGELREGTDLRTASLCYLSPLLMGLLHQHQLAGAGCRPLDAYAFLDAHTEGWLRAWGVEPGGLDELDEVTAELNPGRC